MFDALQTLLDSDVLSQDALKAVLTKIVENDEDDDDVKRAVFMLWQLDNGIKAEPDNCEPTGYPHYNVPVFNGNVGEYAVFTDEEADEACTEYIKDSLWAFRPEFLESQTGIDSEAFAALAEKCESGNDAVLRIVEKTCGIAELVEDAVRADGRGHFMSSYDGEEHEFNVCGRYFYIYRTN